MASASNLQASRDEIWSQQIDPILLEPIRQIAGPTTRTLPALARANEKFDFIFIDAGHDLYSVAHDLAYSVEMLAPGGAILMDDFAPMEEFGVGTCIAAQHARRLFGKMEIIPTEGPHLRRSGTGGGAAGNGVPHRIANVWSEREPRPPSCMEGGGKGLPPLSGCALLSHPRGAAAPLMPSV